MLTLPPFALFPARHASLQTNGLTMTDTQPEATVVSDVRAASGAAIGALAAAADDLHRAALCLNQMASGISQRIRGPEDCRRIARQFSDRASACKAAEEALVAAWHGAARFQASSATKRAITRAYGGCVEPGGMDLTEVYQQQPCPKCGQPAHSWWIERAEGTLNLYEGLSCTACGYSKGEHPDEP